MMRKPLQKLFDFPAAEEEDFQMFSWKIVHGFSSLWVFVLDEFSRVTKRLRFSWSFLCFSVIFL
jgi:hypothetical protein